MTMAFIFATIGPTVNFMRNVGVMTNSLTCGEIKLKKSIYDIFDTAKKPIVMIRRAVENTIAELQKVAYRVRIIINHIKTLVKILCKFFKSYLSSIIRCYIIRNLLFAVNCIRNVYDWLKDIVSICNTKYDTPFNRCIKVAEKAMKDCR